MKNLLSKGSIAKIALLTLLLLNAFAGMTILVNAPPTKDLNVLITGSGSIELTWKSGKSETYSSSVYAKLGGLDKVAFIPTQGWYIKVARIDGNALVDYDEDGFNLTDGLPKRQVSVTFDVNPGVDDVDEGLGAEAYPDPGVGLIFVNVLDEGWAYAYTIELQETSPIGEFWDIYLEEVVFEPGITVMLVLNLEDVPWATEDPPNPRLFKTEYLLARSDVNWNGVVDGDDVSDVGNVNPSAIGDPDYDPWLDLNDDGFIDDTDVNIVNDYQGMSVWEDITSNVVVDEVNGLVYVYGDTESLSIFGCNRKW